MYIKQLDIRFPVFSYQELFLENKSLGLCYVCLNRARPRASRLGLMILADNLLYFYVIQCRESCRMYARDSILSGAECTQASIRRMKMECRDGILPKNWNY